MLAQNISAQAHLQNEFGVGFTASLIADEPVLATAKWRRIMRTLTSIGLVIAVGLLTANCGLRVADSGQGSAYGYVSAPASAPQQWGGGQQMQTIKTESIPANLKPGSYHCNLDGTPYSGPRPPAECVKH